MIYMFSGDSDLARYAGSLPALRRLTVHLRHSRHGDYSDARGDLDSAEHPENVARRRLIDAENCLEQAAASSVVELLMTEDIW